MSNVSPDQIFLYQKKLYFFPCSYQSGHSFHSRISDLREQKRSEKMRFFLSFDFILSHTLFSPDQTSNNQAYAVVPIKVIVWGERVKWPHHTTSKKAVAAACCMLCLVSCLMSVLFSIPV